MCRTLLINMIHDNPGEPPLVTPTRDPRYLAELGFTGDVVMKSLAGSFLSDYDPCLVPIGTDAHRLAEEHRQRISSRVREIAEAGLDAYLYTDIPSVPKRSLEVYGEKITHIGNDRRLCIGSEQLWEITAAQLTEAFAAYPEAVGCFVRFGENYSRFNTAHMAGNNIIHDIQCPRCAGMDLPSRYRLAIERLREIVIGKLGRSLIIRTWDGGLDGFHANPAVYCPVTDSIEPNDKLYFSAKLTRLDFWRYQPRNPNLGTGGHQQLVEIQLAREYEGKGAYPNWVAPLWLQEAPEVAAARKLAYGRGDKVPCEDKLGRMPLGEGVIRGIFGWTRGGGWRGPYLRYHDWIDIHSFSMGIFAADPKNFDPYDAARKWCSHEYGWDQDSAQTADFVAVLDDSPQAVLKTFYCDAYYTRPGADWGYPMLWARDDHLITSTDSLDAILMWALENGKQDHVLQEKEEAVMVWRRMAERMNRIAHAFTDNPRGRGLAESVEAAALLAEAVQALWVVRLQWLDAGRPDLPLPQDVESLWQDFRRKWLEYQSFDGRGVATLMETGWDYWRLADAFEPASEHFPSSARPIYMNADNQVDLG